MNWKSISIISISCTIFILFFAFKENEKSLQYEYMYFTFVDKGNVGFVSTAEELKTVPITRSKVNDFTSIMKSLNDFQKEGWEVIDSEIYGFSNYYLLKREIK